MTARSLVDCLGLAVSIVLMVALIVVLIVLIELSDFRRSYADHQIQLQLSPTGAAMDSIHCVALAYRPFLLSVESQRAFPFFCFEIFLDESLEV